MVAEKQIGENPEKKEGLECSNARTVAKAMLNLYLGLRPECRRRPEVGHQRRIARWWWLATSRCFTDATTCCLFSVKRTRLYTQRVRCRPSKIPAWWTPTPVGCRCRNAWPRSGLYPGYFTPAGCGYCDRMPFVHEQRRSKIRLPQLVIPANFKGKPARNF